MPAASLAFGIASFSTYRAQTALDSQTRSGGGAGITPQKQTTTLTLTQAAFWEGDCVPTKKDLVGLWKQNTLWMPITGLPGSTTYTTVDKKHQHGDTQGLRQKATLVNPQWSPPKTMIASSLSHPHRSSTPMTYACTSERDGAHPGKLLLRQPPVHNRVVELHTQSSVRLLVEDFKKGFPTQPSTRSPTPEERVKHHRPTTTN